MANSYKDCPCKKRHSSCDERGTFTVWALALCLILFLISGLSVDLWRAIDARRELNEIADTAARSGASEINVPERQLFGRVVLDSDLAESSATESITENAGLQSVNVDSQNISVDAVNNEVNVELTSTYSFFLLEILPGASDAQIVARSSARPFEE